MCCVCMPPAPIPKEAGCSRTPTCLMQSGSVHATQAPFLSPKPKLQARQAPVLPSHCIHSGVLSWHCGEHVYGWGVGLTGMLSFWLSSCLWHSFRAASHCVRWVPAIEPPALTMWHRPSFGSA